MADDYLDSVRREAQRLEAELSTNPTFIKFQLALKTIEYYSIGVPIPAAARRVSPHAPVRTPPTRQKAPATLAIEQAVTDYLRAKGERFSAGRLFKNVFVAQGLKIGGKDALRSFSALMSSSKLFTNVPGEGYGLAEWGKGPPPLRGMSGEDMRSAGIIPPQARLPMELNGTKEKGPADAEPS